MQARSKLNIIGTLICQTLMDLESIMKNTKQSLMKKRITED